MLETEISITGEPITDAMCRFTVDRPVYPDKSFAFLSKEAAEGSTLAKRLFEIDGITRVLISHDQITINKSAQADWPVIGKSIGAAIRAHLATDDPAVSDAARENMPSSEDIRERRFSTSGRHDQCVIHVVGSGIVGAGYCRKMFDAGDLALVGHLWRGGIGRRATSYG